LPEAFRNELSEAYRRYWEVRSDAFYNLDADILLAVSYGSQLEREGEEISRLRAQGMAVVTSVAHRFQIVSAQSDRAIIYDEIESRSYLIDITTRRQIEEGEQISEKERIAFELRKVGNTWKVSNSESFNG
jgi:hypothetical protein